LRRFWDRFLPGESDRGDRVEALSAASLGGAVEAPNISDKSSYEQPIELPQLRQR
jgi:hypothetical protein